MLGRVVSATWPRLLGALVVLWLLTSLVFFALRLLPGDPATLILGEQASDAARAALRSRLGLDRPLAVQYVRHLLGLVTLDLGWSLSRPGVPALREVGAALGPTAALASLSVLLGTLGGLWVALLSVGPFLGPRRIWAHRATLAVASLPLLSFAPLLTWLLAVRLRWVPLPGDPTAGVGGLLFAAGLLALPLGAQVSRIGRASLLELARAKFLDAAAAKGAGPWRIWVIHALPVAAAPITVVVATQLGALLGGAVVLERLFERPGLGSLMLRAYATRDLPVLEGSVVVAGLLFVAAQAGASAFNAWLDPRGGGR